MSDPPQAYVTKFIYLCIFLNEAFVMMVIEPRPFSHDDNGKTFAPGVTRAERLGHLIQIERLFRDKDGIGAPG